ncbi:MAG: inositol monophosphatase [Planctomycetota bacterium]
MKNGNGIPNGAFEFAGKLARDAGKFLHSRFTRPAVRGRWKGLRHLQIQEDRLTDALIRKRIRKAFPDHTLTTEESGTSGRQAYRWIVDPLDGTHNYARRMPWYCVSIALVRGDEFLVGALDFPEFGWTLTAAKGRGAFLNGKPLRVSRVRDLMKACVAFDSGLTSTSLHAKTLIPVANAVFLMRMTGSTAMNLALVAMGKADIFMDFDSYAWDHAAGVLIVREAGGIVTSINGVPVRPDSAEIIATNGILHDKTLKLLRRITR